MLQQFPLGPEVIVIALVLGFIGIFVYNVFR
jgi:hypothetical protein